MLDYEFQFYSDKINFIAGCDEAGRGPLAGPVVAAAVIFPKDYKNEEINDSKKLTPQKREALYDVIKQNSYFSDTITLWKFSVIYSSWQKKDFIQQAL